MSLLETILDSYPRFFTKSRDSNHVKYHSVLSGEYLTLNQEKAIVSLATNVTRPLKLWKVQTKDYAYTMMVEVNLQDLKQVQLYKDGTTPTLIYDSGVLDEGTTSFEYEYSTTSISNIPTEQYFLVVTDYDENTFTKGYPENNTVNDNMYDHDSALDVFGINFSIPRRVYQTVAESDYGSTYPTYSNDLSEADYWYEMRIKESVLDFVDLELPVSELKQYFGNPDDPLSIPRVIGRWRSVCRMGTGNADDQFPGSIQGGNTQPSGINDVPDAKYMEASEWNSSVFDVTVDPSRIPKNFTFTTEDYLQSMVDKAFSLGKKAYIQYLLTQNIGLEDVIISDYLSMPEFSYITDVEMVSDSHYITVGGSSNQIDDLLMSDTFEFELDSRCEVCGLNDYMNGIQHDIISFSTYADINTGIQIGVIVNNVSPVTVTLDGNTYTSGNLLSPVISNNTYQAPVNCGAWINPMDAGDPGTDSYAYATFTGTGNTEYLSFYNFSTNLPFDSIPNTITIVCKHQLNTTTPRTFDLFLYTTNNGYEHVYTGNSSDNGWILTTVEINNDDGRYSYSDINEMFVSYKTNAHAAGNRAEVGYLYVIVSYYYSHGFYVAPAMSVPAGGNWTTFTSGISGGGTQYQILDEDTWDVLMTVTEGTADISSISAVDHPSLQIQATILNGEHAVAPFVLGTDKNINIT